MDLELQDKVIVVTGGTDGLGAALARSLVAEGARVAVCGRDRDRLTDAEDRLGDDGLVVRADVTVPAELEQLVDRTIERWGRIDGLVNNAGRASGGRFEDVDDQQWDADLELKVMAAVRLIRLCLPHLRAGAGTSIVNVLNIGARAPGAGSLPTTASRAAGLAVTKALSKELGPDGIRVNAVLVGLVESGQWRRRAEATGRGVDEVYAEMAPGIPLGRVGQAQEYADLVSYLLSPRSSYVTGCAINLDGGTSPVA
jgi:NAD(P)-dependent dehydrogenase (short-subunit alcohol dehydrogenase family)